MAASPDPPLRHAFRLPSGLSDPPLRHAFRLPPGLPNPALHHAFRLPPGLPPAADKLVQKLLIIFADCVDSPADLACIRRPEHFKGSCNASRAPKLSVQGLVALLLGVSSTLMLFGSFAFLLGFVLVLLILPASIFVCVSGYLSTFNIRQPPSSASFTVWRSEILQKGSWFKL